MIRFILSVVLLFLPLTSCTSSGDETTSIASSGHGDLDKTAEYALFTIRKVKKRSGMNSPSQVLTYMLSTEGSAALTPPNPELEPDMADIYRGPRPANGVGLYDTRKEVLGKEIILEADDEKGLIIAKAYENESGDLLHTWEWKF